MLYVIGQGLNTQLNRKLGMPLDIEEKRDIFKKKKKPKNRNEKNIKNTLKRLGYTYRKTHIQYNFNIPYHRYLMCSSSS